MTDIIVVKPNIPNRNLEILQELHPNSIIVKEGEYDRVVVLKRETTDKQLECVRKVFPNSKIIVKEVEDDERANE